MIKIAVITEGHCELIFVRELILRIFNYQNIEFLCLRLSGNRQDNIPYEYLCPDPAIYFQIICVGNDTKVLSFIRDRYRSLLSSGFELIIALRDVYSEEYKKRSRTIDQIIIDELIKTHQETIDSFMTNGCHIQLHFSIMEYEAWLLSMPNLFAKLNPTLTTEFIQENLDYDLNAISPEITFFHPTTQLTEILGLSGISYDKSQNQMESIVGHLNLEDYQDAIKDNRCPSFESLFSKINNLSNEYVVD